MDTYFIKDMHLFPLPAIACAASALRKKYGPGAAMAWGPLACMTPLDPDPKLAVVTSQGVLLCGAKIRDRLQIAKLGFSLTWF